MEKEKQINLEFSNENMQCKTCKWGLLINPYLLHCTKYKEKPREVYFEGKDCPEYIEEEEE